MVTAQRQQHGMPGFGQAQDPNYQFTIRPELSPSSELAESSMVDYQANAIIAEFKEKGGQPGQAEALVKMLLDHIDLPKVREYVIDCLKVSNESAFESSSVRAEVFSALGAYISEREVQIICVQEFKRRALDATSCQAAYEVLAKKTSWAGTEAQEFCQKVVLENSKELSQGKVFPGHTYALKALGRSPDGTKVSEAILACINAYKDRAYEPTRLDVLMALGTEQAIKTVCDIAAEKVRPRWSIWPQNNFDDLITYNVVMGMSAGFAALTSGLVLDANLHSASIGVGGILAAGVLCYFLPTILKATYESIFRCHGLNTPMSEYALTLLAGSLPNARSEEIVLNALMSPERAIMEGHGERLNNNLSRLASALTKAKETGTIQRIAQTIESGPDEVRLALLNAFASSPNPRIRKAIVTAKNDVSIAVSELAMKIVRDWK